MERCNRTMMTKKEQRKKIITKDVHAARQALVNLKDSSITAAFQRVTSSRVTYSHCSHTAAETRYVSLL